MSPIERLRVRMREAILVPFSHGSDPLANTLDHTGDTGLFGPDSVTWPVMGDVAALIGGVRALLIQFAHPEVAAGMEGHSSYERDPMGRISRTTDYVAATSFGAMPEVTKAVHAVRRAHRTVAGTSHRGRNYTADDHDLASWVHNALSGSFLDAYQHFGPARLSDVEADRYAAEQAMLGALIGASELPDTARHLSDWISTHSAVAPSPGAQRVVPFISAPPSRPFVKVGYKVLFWAASATIPRRIRGALGVRRYPGALLGGRLLCRGLRWIMGSSPAWRVAIIRCNAPTPPAVEFREPLSGGRTAS